MFALSLSFLVVVVFFLSGCITSEKLEDLVSISAIQMTQFMMELINKDMKTCIALLDVFVSQKRKMKSTLSSTDCSSMSPFSWLI